MRMGTDKCVFVTGGSGYVGRNVIRRLVADGLQVRALARSEASAGIVAALGAEPRRGDILDRASLESAMIGCEWLIHAAADTAHGAFAAHQHHTNLEGTRNVLHAARAAGIRRAVHVSTEAVLLSGAPLRNVNEETPIPARHAGGYSASKAAAEQTALAENNAGLEVIVVRPRFVWGRDDTTALPQLVAAARSGKLAWIGGGTYLTSTTHIDNVAEGIVRALAQGRGGEAYFVTDGAPVEFRAFVSALLRRAGIEPPGKTAPRWLVATVASIGDWLERVSGGRIKPPIGRQEYGTVGVEVTLDITKAERELGYRPVITREMGMETVQAAELNSM
jgi:nucleoside-diphosphate-sugar epimerase